MLHVHSTFIDNDKETLVDLLFSDTDNNKMVVSEEGLKQLVDSQENTDTVSKKFRSMEELKRLPSNRLLGSWRGYLATVY